MSTNHTTEVMNAATRLQSATTTHHREWWTLGKLEQIECIATIIDEETSAHTQQARIDQLEEIEAKAAAAVSNYSARIESLEAKKAELVEGCKFFMDALEQGLLVRDISKDEQPDWALKMMEFVKQLQKVQIAIAKTEPTNPKAEVK